MSQLNGNPFLSKDWLIRVRNSIYFNKCDAYLSTTSSSNIFLLGLESNYGMYFISSASGQNKGRKYKEGDTMARSGRATPIARSTSQGSWYIGCVQWIRGKVGAKWSISRQSIVSMNIPNVAARKASGGSVFMVLCN